MLEYIWPKEGAKRDALPSDRFVIDAEAPLANARLFIEKRYRACGVRILHHHRGVFFRWSGKAYVAADEAALRAQVYAFLDRCVTEKGQPFKPNKIRGGYLVDALKAASNLEAGISAPTWLEQVPDLLPEDIIACSNGLLHLPTMDLLPHTPSFFTQNALDFGFDRTASQSAAVATVSCSALA